MRADSVPFGDWVVIDPVPREAVTHHRGSRRSLREPITQSLGGQSGTQKHPGRWSSGASDDRRRRAITGKGQMFAIERRTKRTQYGPNGIGFGANETPPFKGLWGSSIETG